MGAMTDRVWFTADTHLGHRLVSGLRGFESVADHDDTICHNWSTSVPDDAEVWVAGDLAFDGWENRLAVFNELPGRKHLVLGNHDRAHPLNSRAHEYLEKYRPYFATVQTVAQVSTKGARKVLVSHFPYTGDHGKDRYDEWRLRDTGRPLVHGHTHSDTKLSWTAAGTLQVNVALEAWELRPVGVSELAEILREHAPL